MKYSKILRWNICLLLLFAAVILSGMKSFAQENTAPVPAPDIQITRKKVEINLQRRKSMKLRALTMNAAGKKVTWSSSRKSIVEVNQFGTITAKKSGTAVITARIKGTFVTDQCEVQVSNYKIMKMRTTGYCNCRRCAGRWAGHATASGKMPRANHTIAVDPHLIKLGTRVQIGNRIYTAEDTGGAIKGNRIDVYYSSHHMAQRHGVQYRFVKVFY